MRGAQSSSLSANQRAGLAIRVRDDIKSKICLKRSRKFKNMSKIIKKFEATRFK